MENYRYNILWYRLWFPYSYIPTIDPFHFPFQLLFHHIFVQLLNDIGNYVVAKGQYAIEFQQKGVFLFIYLRFWRDEQLCRVFLKQTGRVVGQTGAELSLLSSVLAAISTHPNLVCCNEGSFDLIQVLDVSTLFS